MGEVVDLFGDKAVEKSAKRLAIEKLKDFKGEVNSKNVLRQMPNTMIGDIYWVVLDNAAFIVTDKRDGKLTLRRLDETASISTGITIFEMNKKIVSEEPLFDWSDTEIVNGIEDDFGNWITGTNNEFYLLYGKDIHYVTLLKASNEVGNCFKKLRELFKDVGQIISIDFDTIGNEKCVEIWIRTEDSSAELLYLMPYDQGLVEF